MLFVTLLTELQLAGTFQRKGFARSTKKFKPREDDLLKLLESDEGNDKIENNNYLV